MIANRFEVISGLLLIFFTSGNFAHIEADKQNGSSLSDPLIYQRLRFDGDFLQIYRRYQKYLKEDEKRVILRYNETHSSGDAAENKTRETSVSYYENDQVESTSITQEDLVFEALHLSYLTRLMPAYVYSYDDREDLVRASDPKLVSLRRCQRDLDFLLEQLNAVQKARSDSRTQISLSSQTSPELMALFDSFATEEPGLLFGNYHWVGNWRECYKRRVFALNRANASDLPIDFRGRYCIASIRSPKWDEKIRQGADELERKRHFKYAEQRQDYARFFRIQLGICLPESCDSRVVQERRADIHRLAVFKLSEPLRSYKLADLYCLPDETSELRKVEPSGKVLLFLLGAWCALIVMCTAYDYYILGCALSKPVTTMQKLVNSLSIVQNYDRLIETRSCQATTNGKKVAPAGSQASKSVKPASEGVGDKNLHPNDLLFLNAIKVVTTPMIIFGHVGMLFKHLDRFVINYDGLESDYIFHFQASTPFFVDWYFVITGFLTTYLMFVTRKVERNSTIQWFYTVFHRYWRLAPLYVLLFWVSKSLFMYTSYGPLWDYGTNNMTLRAICRRESWIWPLTLTSNLHPIHEECILPAWYIACDMQFYLVTPFILILLHKSPLMGWLATIGAIGASISLRLHRYLTDERAPSLDLMRPRYDLYMRNNWDIHATYLYPQYRIATYLIGVLAGHYTYMVLSGKWKSLMYVHQDNGSTEARSRKSKGSVAATNSISRFGALLRLFAWIFGFKLLAALMFATLLLTNLFPENLERHVKYIAAVAYSSHHAAAGLGMALVLVTLMLGQFPGLKQFLSHPYWTVLSRVNFIVYLTQVEWIYWLLQSGDGTVQLSALEMLKIFLYLCCFVYSFATICTLIFELPLAQLEKNFIGVLLERSFGSKRDTVQVTSGKAQRACEMALSAGTNESSLLVDKGHGGGSQGQKADNKIGCTPK